MFKLNPDEVHAFCLRGREVDLCRYVNERIQVELDNGTQLYGKIADDGSETGWYPSRYLHDTHTGTLVELKKV